MYRADEVSEHRACCERATQPYSLEGGGTIYPGSRPAGVYHTVRSPRMVTECLLTRSMLIKIKLTFFGSSSQHHIFLTTHSVGDKILKTLYAL